MFENIINWRLLKGSHEFPGPDGGTCVTEAAIVAAGLDYKKIGICWDCPPCFSWPVAAYAIALNDRLPDDLRQELLMPFVTRLAWTADHREIEMARVRLIAFRTIRDILPVALRAAGLDEHARRCEAAEDFDAAVAAADATRSAAFRRSGAAAYAAARYALAAAQKLDADATARNAADAADVTRIALGRTEAKRQIFELCVSILDEAIRLGNPVQPVESTRAAERMDRVKRRALERTLGARTGAPLPAA